MTLLQLTSIMSPFCFPSQFMSPRIVLRWLNHSYASQGHFNGTESLLMLLVALAFCAGQVQELFLLSLWDACDRGLLCMRVSVNAWTQTKRKKLFCFDLNLSRGGMKMKCCSSRHGSHFHLFRGQRQSCRERRAFNLHFKPVGLFLCCNFKITPHSGQVREQ